MNSIVKLLDLNRLFYVLLLGLLFWHLWSIFLSPLPWFDEVFFASISQSFSSGNGFLLESCSILYEGDEVLTYGPVYFILTKITTSFGGLNLFSFRIVNFSFGILSIFIFYKILRAQSVSKAFGRLMVLMLSFDVIFIQNSHSGRMDLVALFFLLSSYYVFLTKRETLKASIWIGLLVALGLLTTPRISILIFPFLIYFLINNFKLKRWLNILVLMFIPLLFYLSWIFYGFGSIENFINYYFGENVISSSKISLVDYFLLGNFRIPFFQWPIVIVGLVSFFYTIFRHKKNAISTILFILPIISFYILIKDTGIYSALIIPFWYLIIGVGLKRFMEEKNLSFNRLSLLFTSAILFVSVSIFLIKATVIVLNQHGRDSFLIEQWLSDKMPINSTVAGDFKYFYAVTNNNSNFQFIEWGKSLEERAAYHSNIKKVDYLMLSKDLSKEYLEAYKVHFNIEEVHHFDLETKDNIVLRKIRRIIPNVNSSYEGSLFKLSLKDSKSN
jgi:4-amino-4-deoxy-L-arabinose transferase-like glycosyltransferase